MATPRSGMAELARIASTRRVVGSSAATLPEVERASTGTGCSGTGQYGPLTRATGVVRPAIGRWVAPAEPGAEEPTPEPHPASSPQTMPTIAVLGVRMDPPVLRNPTSPWPVRRRDPVFDARADRKVPERCLSGERSAEASPALRSGPPSRGHVALVNRRSRRSRHRPL